jgi:spore germination cell wall hydrolase CwlJ-like protein
MTAVIAKFRRPATALFTALVVVVGASILSLRIPFHKTVRQPRAISAVHPELPSSNLMRPISPQVALRENATRSFSHRRDSAAAAFRFAGDSATKERALECLTQAAYYEAASDGPEAERAVAQVVLNRVRHPGYPPNICGVVYEGSQSPGCQFTFTCDGSLRRPPIPALWRQAHQAASEELNGKVFAPVGHATHYHADYVLPYWAEYLDKSVQIGQQIFYRLRGVAGEAAAFSQHYNRHEPAPSLLNPLSAAGETPSSVAAAVAGGENSQSSSGPENKLPQPNSDLIADGVKPVLIADGLASAQPHHQESRAASASDAPCQPGRKPIELLPLSADDHRSGRSADCP